MVLVLEHRHEPTVVVVAHQPDAGLHAQHALVLAARHGHVGHGAELELGHPLRSTHELRQPSAIALHHRQPDDLDIPTDRPLVDRNLEIRPIPRLERTRDKSAARPDLD